MNVRHSKIRKSIENQYHHQLLSNDENINLFENILTLNLLGKIFRIPFFYIEKYPKTLLGNKILLEKYYRSKTNDYYFDRNPFLFQYLFTYYTLEQKIYCPN